MRSARQKLHHKLLRSSQLSIGHTFIKIITVTIVLMTASKARAQVRPLIKPANQQASALTAQLDQPVKQQTDNEKLTLKVCCGDKESNCEEFQRPEDMFGIGCCSGHPINEFEEICCEGVTRRRRQTSSYVEGCCGNQTLSFDQTCCQGVVHNVPNGECCGSQAYPRNNMNILCCNGVLNVNVEPGLTCCGTTPYDGGIRESCCGDAVFLKELYDGCCPVRDSDPPEYRQFNSRTHQCCDIPIERYSNTKCCQLHDPNAIHDQWSPKSYDSSMSCCAFPFTTIVPKNSDGTCVRVTAPLTLPPKTPGREGTVTNLPSREAEFSNKASDNNNAGSNGRSNGADNTNTNNGGSRRSGKGGISDGRGSSSDNNNVIVLSGDREQMTNNNNSDEERGYEDEEFGPEEPEERAT